MPPEVIYLGSKELEPILTEGIRILYNYEKVEKIEFYHDNEYESDQKDGIFVIFEATSNGTPGEEEIDASIFSILIEDWLDQKYFVKGIRYFTVHECIGVAAIVKPKG